MARLDIETAINAPGLAPSESLGFSDLWRATVQWLIGLPVRKVARDTKMSENRQSFIKEKVHG
jgi:hypothetical protein